MKLFEYQAKDLFKKNGINVPTGKIVQSAEEAEEVATEFGIPLALKSQVLVGGRGKAGGIKFADTPSQTYEIANQLLKLEIKGETVEKILMEEKLNVESEFYISVVMDRSAKKPLIMASTQGGMDIEQVAMETPEKLIKYHVNPLEEFLPYQAREIAIQMGVPNPLISKVSGFIFKLFTIFEKYDATTSEINPLVVTPNGVVAADGKFEIDDDALYRQPELLNLVTEEKDEFAYVKLDGDIAVIGNGAGLTLTGMDMLKLYGGKPATFLDIGGGASQENIAQALDLVISNPQVKVVFLNVLGGITRADDVAGGVINVLNETKRKIPLVIRLTGTNEEEGQRILTDAGVSYETSMEAAAEKAVEMARSLN
jgi:succinyl-CoA synthetase beta subunit